MNDRQKAIIFAALTYLEDEIAVMDKVVTVNSDSNEVTQDEIHELTKEFPGSFVVKDRESTYSRG